MKRVRDIPKPPVRPVDAHKGTAGLVLVVAGSRGMAGAAALVGNGALRAGAGLVRIATADAALDTVATLAPCCTTAPLPDDGACLRAEAAERILELAADQDAVALGPGLGRTPAVGSIVRAVLEGLEIPIVLDADGLNAIAADAAETIARARNGLILTPHPGEAARLLGTTVKAIQADREAAAERLARLGAVAVLKGAGTVVCDGERLYVNETGNPGMATAGAGDVLTGMMAAFLAAGMPMFEAAVLAVWAHGRAGDLAAERLGILGLTAMDLLGCVPEALRV
ncbi:MAG: NAD(P)H-hydrate dehydratase [Phycisphaerae bacterium]